MFKKNARRKRTENIDLKRNLSRSKLLETNNCGKVLREVNMKTQNCSKDLENSNAVLEPNSTVGKFCFTSMSHLMKSCVISPDI